MTPAANVEVALAPRSGLGAVGERLARQPCTIAYMGASVTVQSRGYRPRLHDALNRRFAPRHLAVAAAVGGVSAVSAVFLMDRLVLARRPDLCLIEYSSGDMATSVPIEEIEAAAEGIAEKLADAGSAAVILHLYRAEWAERCAEVVAAWERVAERRGLPSINVGAALHAQFRSGRLEPGELISDGIHTTPAGADVVAGMVDRAVARLASADPAPGPVAGEAPAPAGMPGVRHDFRLAQLVGASLADSGGAGSAGRFRLQLPFLETGVDQPVVFNPPGELLGLAVIIGPDSGEITVSGAGGTERAMLWDDHCFYERLSTVLFERSRPAGDPVRIMLTDTPIDYSLCRRPIEPRGHKRLRIAGYMVLGPPRS